MHNLELEKKINKYLNINQYVDCIPNGLQIEGATKIKKIVTGVTASQKLINAAIKLKADSIIVHHGFFWKNESIPILNMKKKRIKSLLCNDINLYSYHLPLDAHPIIGNNVQFGNIMKLKIKKFITPFLPIAQFKKPISASNLILFLYKKFKKKPLHLGDNKKKIYKIAWCTGKGQNLLQKAALSGADAFITGEVSEETYHITQEMKIHFFAIGHHTSEKFGIQALGLRLQKKYKFLVNFIDIPNPI